MQEKLTANAAGPHGKVPALILLLHRDIGSYHDVHRDLLSTDGPAVASSAHHKPSIMVVSHGLDQPVEPSGLSIRSFGTCAQVHGWYGRFRSAR